MSRQSSPADSRMPLFSWAKGLMVNQVKLTLFALGCSLAANVVAQADSLQLPIAPGKFSDTRDSLTNYVCPEWFRDAKFGIWAHWGPQAVPMEGDWYARKMYQQGSRDYEYHLNAGGTHRQTAGKTSSPLQPEAEKVGITEKLMDLYKKAGAKYFVSMGSHHDDFFLWNSGQVAMERSPNRTAPRYCRRMASRGSKERFGVWRF